jgi:hypothetical protein
MIRIIVRLFCCGAICQWAVAAGSAVPAGAVRLEAYGGWTNALMMAGGDCRLVVLPSVGGRIVQYSLNGDNILYEEPGSGGKTIESAPEGFVVGGYQCELGPVMPGLPDRTAFWVGPWKWVAPRPNQVRLDSEPDPALGVRVSREILMDPDSGEIGLEQRVTNVSNKEAVVYLWDRTLCKGDGFALLPMAKKSRFPAGWSVARRDAAGKVSYESGAAADPRVKVLEQILVVQARGAPMKVGVDSDQGWMAYTTGRLLLVKYFAWSPKGNYTDGGNTMEFSFEEKRAELQPLGPESRLQPGESDVLPEKWLLLDLQKSVSTFAEARALARRIPPSPFRK